MKLLFLFIITCLFQPSAMGCWMPPKDVVVSQADRAGNYYERYNKTGVIKVYKGQGASKKFLWSAKLQGFNNLFSKVQLLDGGKTVVHYKLNNAIYAIDDVAFEVYKKDRSHFSLPVSYFMKKLLVNPNQSLSTAPKHLWLNKVSKLTGKKATIITAENKVVKLNFRKLLVHPKS